MPNPVRTLARPMLGSMFVLGGMDQLQNPEPKVPVADPVAPEVAETAGFGDVDTATLVQVNGAVQVIGGLALALGKAPRTAATLLAASLVPTTLAAHRFWDEQDPNVRAQQQVHFFKNVGLLGGLLVTTQDTEGRPSATWAAKHSIDLAGLKAAETAAKAETTRVRAEKAASEASLGAKLAASEKKADLATSIARGAAKVAAAAVGAATGMFGKRAGQQVRYTADRATKQAQLARAKTVPDLIDLTGKAASKAADKAFASSS